MKIEIKQCGYNQGIVVNSNGKKVYVKEVNESGEKTVPIDNRESWMQSLRRKAINKGTILTFSATVLVIVVGIVVAGHFKYNTKEDRLFAQYYKPLKENSGILSMENTAFDEAKKRYAEGDHVAAWLIMKNLPTSFTFKKEKNFYQALTLIELEKYDLAILKFDSLLANPYNKDVFSLAHWYQGLCYLKIKDLEQAKYSFRAISPNFPKQHKKAQKILSKLND